MPELPGLRRALIHLASWLATALAAMVVANPAMARGYSTWESHDPGVCLDPAFDYYYGLAIHDAWVNQGNKPLARTLLKQYVDSVRCNQSIGSVMATYTPVPAPDSSLAVSDMTVSISTELEQKGVTEGELQELDLGETPPAEELLEEWLGALEFREDIVPDTTIPVGDPFAVPHFCLGFVVIWQDVSKWMIGEWNARHRGMCIGPTFGTLYLDLYGDYVEPGPTQIGQAIYHSVHAIRIPAGGNWDRTETFKVRPTFVFRWSDDSTYQFDVFNTGEPSEVSRALSKRPINKKGREYPNIQVQARGPVPFPDIPPTFTGITPRLGAGQWDALCKAAYQQNGWPYPENLMPVSYQNHHVRPLRWNGPNAAANCYRLESNHHYFYSVWWQPRSNFQTPLSQ